VARGQSEGKNPRMKATCRGRQQTNGTKTIDD
jgi:hypothetical protein